MFGPGPPPEETGGGWREEVKTVRANSRKKNQIQKFHI